MKMKKYGFDRRNFVVVGATAEKRRVSMADDVEMGEKNKVGGGKSFWVTLGWFSNARHVLRCLIFGRDISRYVGQVTLVGPAWFSTGCLAVEII